MQTNNILRYAVLGGVFLVPFIFLIVSETLFFPFITGKGFTFRLIVEIIFGLWIILALRDRTYMPRFSKLTLALCAFTGIVFIADMAGMNPSKSFWSNYERMEGFVVIIHLLGYYLVASSVLNTEKLWNKFIHTTFGVGLFLSLYGFLQKLGEIKINQSDVRLDATLGNSIYLALTMLFFVFFALFWYARNKKDIGAILSSWMIGLGLFVAYPFYYFFQKMSLVQDYYGKAPIPQEVKDRIYFWVGQDQAGVTTGLWQPTLFWVAIFLLAGFIYVHVKRNKLNESVQKWGTGSMYGVMVVMNIVILFYTGTRGTSIALFGGLFLSALLIAIFAKQQATLRKSALAVVIIIPLLIGVFYTAKDSDFVKSRPMLARYALVFTYENKTQARGYVWPMALTGFKENPILGWGQENFNYVFNKNYDPQMYTHEQWFDRAHNVFLDWLIAGGLLAFAGYISLYIIALYFIWRREEQSLSIYDKAVLTGLLGAYAVHNMFVFDNLVSYILFFTLLAYVRTISRPTENKTLANLKLEDGLVETVIAPIIVVATIFSMYAINWNGYFASKTLISALQQQKEGPTKNLELFKEVFEYNSFGNTEAREQLSMMAGQVLRSDVDPNIQQQFLALIRKQVADQIKATPSDTRAYVFAGALFGQIGLLAEAEKYLEKASELSPNKQSILIQLGENKLNLGKVDEALALFKKAYELVPAHDEARSIYTSVLVFAKKDKEAEKILLEKYGTTVVADERLLQAYLNVKNYKKALPISSLLVEKEPQNVKHRFALAVSEYKLGQTSKAITDLNMIVKIQPGAKDQIDGYIKLMLAGKEIQ